MGNDAPTNPSLKACLTVVEAPIQAMSTLEDADPSFDAMMVATATTEPTLPFVLLSLR